MLNPNTYEEIADWCDLLDAFNLFSNSSQQWIFRGQPSSKYPLATKLERDLKDFKVDMKEALRIEGGLLRRFKRQCHHYIAHPPDEDNTLEWLALMRHYEAPTRLLDWTYSFFVASYFALEKAKEEKEPNGNDTGIWECAVWVLTPIGWWIESGASLRSIKSATRTYGGASRVMKTSPNRVPSSNCLLEANSRYAWCLL